MDIATMLTYHGVGQGQAKKSLVTRGSAQFPGDGNELIIPHGMEDIPSYANATPNENPKLELGEVWVRVDETNIYIGNSGKFTGGLNWVIFE